MTHMGIRKQKCHLIAFFTRMHVEFSVHAHTHTHDVQVPQMVTLNIHIFPVLNLSEMFSEAKKIKK